MPRDPRQPLARTTVLLARPVGHSETLARRIAAAGGDVVVLPTSSLRGCTDPQRARETLSRTGNAFAVIFISPTAVRHAWRLAPALGFGPRTEVVAVGPSTARSLARHAIEAEVPEQRYDSEGVLALPLFATPRGKRVVLIGAPGGRGEIAASLARRGAIVEHAHVYARCLPRWRASHLAALREAVAPRVLMVSSVDAVEALRKLMPAADFKRLLRDRAVVSSDRDAKALRMAGMQRVVVAGSALPAALVAAAVSSR